eukprot:GFUD01105313.1.p1 GENE.GFUD01105313.1~~GFUD01105313.1.p1  ORF type:complete len:307 (+),score=67.83 GFUD01105313.1:129-1049(+)
MVAKFEVADIPGKGFGMLATEGIQRGETVLEESVILNARVVGGKDDFHNTSFLNRQVSLLSVQDRKEFLSLNDLEPDGPAEMKNERIYVNNTFFDGFYLKSSRMNHSCKPNVMLSSDDTVHAEIVALRDILEGEEILVSYLRTSALETKDERSEKIKKWKFECNCELCCLEGEDQLRNDQKRKEARNNLKSIDTFFDEVWRDQTILPEIVRPLIMGFFTKAEDTQKILSSDLQGESSAALVSTYLKMAELVAFSESEKFQILLSDNRTQEDFMDLARKEAALMGKMFLSNCNTTERELKELHEEFG